VSFRSDWLRREGDENRWEGKPKLPDCVDSPGTPETPQFNHLGLEAKRNSGLGRSVFS
jgi:hypothetical protein